MINRIWLNNRPARITVLEAEIRSRKAALAEIDCKIKVIEAEQRVRKEALANMRAMQEDFRQLCVSLGLEEHV